MPLLIGVVALSGLLLIVSHWPWPLVLLTVFALFAVSFVTAYAIYAGRTVLHLGRSGTLKWRKCRYCTAGSQWLDPDLSGWGPIPEDVRIVQDGGTHFEAPQGNIRRCPHCQLGGHWVDKSGDSDG